jgi:hypothetical protein
MMRIKGTTLAQERVHLVEAHLVEVEQGHHQIKKHPKKHNDQVSGIITGGHVWCMLYPH